MSARRIDVHIERVVLRGIDPLDQRAFVNGLKSELARVLGDTQSVEGFDQTRRTPAMRMKTAAMQPGQAGARALGKGIAQAIGKGIKR
jgi:hypothetical protein